MKEKKPEKKSTGDRLDNLEHYLQGQAPHLEAYDPLKAYPEPAPVVVDAMVEESPKTEIL